MRKIIFASLMLINFICVYGDVINYEYGKITMTVTGTEVILHLNESGGFAYYCGLTNPRPAGLDPIDTKLTNINPTKITFEGGKWLSTDMTAFCNWMRNMNSDSTPPSRCLIYDWSYAQLWSDDVFYFDEVSHAVIENIIFPQHLKKLRAGAFRGFTGLKTVTWSYDLEEIGDGAFWNCDGFTSLHIPEGVTKIGSQAFGGMDHLKYVVLPSTLEYIGCDVFLNDPEFTDLYSYGEPAQFQFVDPTSGETITITNPVEGAYMTYEEFNSTSGWNTGHDRRENYYTWKLHVQSEYENLYKTAFAWRWFYTIQNDFPDKDPDDIHYVIYLLPSDLQRPQYTGKVENTKSVYIKTMDPRKYYTICLPFSIPNAIIAKVFGSETKVYTYGGIKNSKILFTESVTDMEANTPYLIKTGIWSDRWEFSYHDANYSDHLAAEQAKAIPARGDGYQYDSEFVGNFSMKGIPSQTYCVSSKKETQFVWYTGRNNTNGWKAYNAIIFVDEYSTNNTSMQGAKLNSLLLDLSEEDAGVATDLIQIQHMRNTNDKIYNLQGIEVKNPSKGIYISNGRKIVLNR